MISALPEEKCGNHKCLQALKNGANSGGFKAVKTPNGYTTGYICKKCGNQSTPSTKKIFLWQQNQSHQNQSYNIANSEMEHRRQWSGLLAGLKKDDPPQNTKMPEWNQVLERMKTKRKEAKTG